MITNERQYRITRKHAADFELAIKKFYNESGSCEGGDSWILEAERDGLKSQLESLNEEMSEYDRLKSGETSKILANSLEQLPTGLIQARIASGLTQRALAQKLGLKEQQIQKYEAECYATASFRRLCQVAQTLNLRVKNEISLPSEGDGCE